jgi:hypothetical protein
MAEPKQPPLAGLIPFLALIVICVSIAFALDVGYGGAVGMTLHSSIGFLLCSLAILRLFDLKRFVAGFALIDPVARNWRAFGFVWPFVELALGEAFFTFIAPPTVYWITRIIGLYLNTSSLLAMRRKLDPGDPRFGNALRAPLPVLMLAEGAILFGMSFVLLWL